jgi:hypothetical protein
MDKETLEEVCDKVLNYLYPNCKKEMSNLQYTNSINSLKSIAKWQQEQDKNKYSEEEVKKLIVDFLFTKGIGKEVGSVKDWFEQFKKK